MVTFSDPRLLSALLALPLLAWLAWVAARRAERALERLVGVRPRHPLLAQRRPGQRRIGTALRLGALALLAIGAAGPEWGHEVVRRGATGSDVVLVVDVSASMDARDVPPSRLEEARREAQALLDRLEGSRIGVVAFAGDAVRLCPLTLDRNAVRLTLESLSSASISEPGTDLGKALRMAVKVMPGGRREEQAVVLWTDGEDLEQGAKAAIQDIEAAGIRVFAVGAGTPAGDVVPVLDDQGRATDIKRDESGTAVRSRLDEDLLRTIARRTRGGYFSAGRPGGELPRLLGALGTVARAGRGQRLVERPVARFPLCAAFAALLIALDLVRTRRRREDAGEPGAALHSEAGTAAAAALLVLAMWPAPAAAQSAWEKGDRAFRAGRWTEAESLYALRLKRGGPAAVKVNRATAGLLAGGVDSAEAELGRLAESDDRAGRAAGYNLGTALGGRREYDPALEQLRRALEREPRDADARWNYELLMRRKEEEKRDAAKRPPQPKQGGGGDQGRGGGQAPQPSQPGPTGPQGSPQPTTGTPPRTSSQGPVPGMDRAQADRLLGALDELQRLERQRRRPVQVVQERRGKDW